MVWSGKKGCIGCQYCEADYWCHRLEHDHPEKDYFDTRECITVTLTEKGYVIPIRDIVRCDIGQFDFVK